ncbi:hypothetical protein AMS68_001859 [Peltaster fructicola]|uniref:Armadillo repeat-containing domain-containing protein n=1 Tax=Peltaster fructicola TaxID=286661 RepID=A0A6H0XNK6_9PEZI|nr:hypothetical protein AMS68_001859 [Peltaster fructicola]
MKDRWLWVGMAITFAGLYGLQAACRAYLESNDNNEDGIDEQQSKPPANTSLSLQTLRTLIDSTNPGISQMAIGLVLARLQDRRTHIDVYRLINADAASSDASLRQTAATTLEYLKHGLSSPEVLSPVLSAASTSSPYLHNNDQLLGLDETIVPSIEVPIAGWTAVPRERPSAGDVDARRRRREAVVLHEGSGEVNEDDIIRPGDLR